MNRLLTIVSLASFATTLSVRAVDPIVPPIAADLGVDPKLVALLSTVFAVPFAIVPAVLGPIADMFGKLRVVICCIVILIAASIVSALAPDYQVLFIARVVSGMAAGGVFPISLALVGDLIPMAERQVALGRFLAVVIAGNLLGAAMSGVVGDLAGWRSVFAVVSGASTVALLIVVFGTRGVRFPPPPPFAISSVSTNYRDIFVNPRAKICFSAVFLEGATIFGMFPFVALMLLDNGEPRASIAGLVISAFSIGGLCYSAVVGSMLGRFSPTRLMVIGGVIASSAIAMVGLNPPWFLQILVFVLLGFGFYTLHGYIQVQASELSSAGRAAAMSLHTGSFFLGQATGPLFYGFGFAHVGPALSLWTGAVVLLMTGLVAARLFYVSVKSANV